MQSLFFDLLMTTFTFSCISDVRWYTLGVIQPSKSQALSNLQGGFMHSAQHSLFGKFLSSLTILAFTTTAVIPPAQAQSLLPQV